MDEVWLPLGTAAIGALAALIGSALSPLVSAHRDQQRWRRQSLADSCAAYLDALADAEQAALNAYLDRSVRIERAEADALVRRIRLTEAQVEIFGSSGLRGELVKARTAVSKVLATNGGPPPAGVVIAKISEPVVAAIRKELGVSSKG